MEAHQTRKTKFLGLEALLAGEFFFCLGKKHFCEGAQRAKRLKLLKSREDTGNEKKNRNVSFPLQNCSEAAFLRSSRSPTPIRNFRNAATLLQGMARWVAPWQMWRSSGRAAPRGPGWQRDGAAPRRPGWCPGCSQASPAGVRDHPLMGRPPHVAMAQPSPPRAQRLERTSSGSLAQSISESSPPTVQIPRQPESRSATGDT